MRGTRQGRRTAAWARARISMSTVERCTSMHCGTDHHRCQMGAWHLILTPPQQLPALQACALALCMQPCMPHCTLAFFQALPACLRFCSPLLSSQFRCHDSPPLPLQVRCHDSPPVSSQVSGCCNDSPFLSLLSSPFLTHRRWQTPTDSLPPCCCVHEHLIRLTSSSSPLPALLNFLCGLSALSAPPC